jgi:hypothetical protein
MNENVCKECDGEVEVGEICHFCGASPAGFENCGTNPVNIQQYIKSDKTASASGGGIESDLDITNINGHTAWE